ncbi:MAG: NAD-dependent epimerase/dehydratase family protein [Desulfobaccales bacterium]
MKILITGGTGFLGSALVRALLAQGHEIVLLKRSFSSTRRLGGALDKTTVYDIDLASLAQIFGEQSPLDAVVCATTLYGRHGEKASEILEVNLAFHLRLIELAAAHQVPAFFNTDSFFGKFPDYQYLPYYTLSKRQFLEWGKLFAQSQKIRFINVRLEHLYGPRDGKTKFTTSLIHSCLKNIAEIKLTFGGQKRDFIYIDDVIAAYKILLAKAISSQDHFQEFEVGTGEGIALRDFAENVRELTGARTDLRFGALEYRPGEIMCSQAHIAPLLALGWLPQVPLQEGISKTINWEKEHLAL